MHHRLRRGNRVAVLELLRYLGGIVLHFQKSDILRQLNGALP